MLLNCVLDNLGNKYTALGSRNNPRKYPITIIRNPIKAYKMSGAIVTAKNVFGVKTVNVYFRFSYRPEKFTEALIRYSDWDNSKDNRSHNVPRVIKNSYCLTYDGHYFVDTNEFIYDFNYEERNVSRSFQPVPGKDVLFFQAAGGCIFNNGDFSK